MLVYCSVYQDQEVKEMADDSDVWSKCHKLVEGIRGAEITGPSVQDQ